MWINQNLKTKEASGFLMLPLLLNSSQNIHKWALINNKHACPRRIKRNLFSNLSLNNYRNNFEIIIDTVICKDSTKKSVYNYPRSYIYQ